MAEEKLSGKIADQIGRAFTLFFNRAAMYSADHPITQQGYSDLHTAVMQGLQHISAVVVIMHQDQFFAEDQPFDPRLNTSRLLRHFKQAGIQSVSFHSGVQPAEVVAFAAIFLDLTAHPDVETMVEAGQAAGVKNIRINHVLFKKVTANDEVVDKSMLQKMSAGEGAGGEDADSAIGKMARGMLMDELQKSLSLTGIMNDPEQASRMILEADEAGQSEAGQHPGQVIVEQLHNIRNRIETHGPDDPDLNRQQLAESVFEMKRQLLGMIAERKSQGRHFANEAQIRSEADEITDRVLVQLVRDEYQQGAITVGRMAHIIRRLIPDPSELKRLLPKIKTALLEEGMALSSFLELTHQLKQELQSEELSEVLGNSAAQMGLDGDDLIQEIMHNPENAAQLIYMASEIRRGTGDEKILSDLMVDYIEKVGSRVALDHAAKKGPAGEKQLRKMLVGIESALVKRMQGRELQTDVLQQVAQKLNQRMESCLARIETQLKERFHGGQKPAESPAPAPGTAAEAAAASEPDTAVVPPSEGRTMAQPHPPPETAAPQILGQDNLKFALSKEIARSIRYLTPFTALVFTVYHITSDPPVETDTIDTDDVNRHLTSLLAKTFREADLVGKLDRDKVMVLLPMTESKPAQSALARAMKYVRQFEHAAGDCALSVRTAGVEVGFDPDHPATLERFLKLADSKITDMVNRLRYIQNIA
ncbi:MAG TPA: hypothetical protein ACFCUC_12760 [Desulfobacterales bacterium]